MELEPISSLWPTVAEASSFAARAARSRYRRGGRQIILEKDPRLARAATPVKNGEFAQHQNHGTLAGGALLIGVRVWQQVRADLAVGSVVPGTGLCRIAAPGKTTSWSREFEVCVGGFPKHYTAMHV